jgi:hypothetical protein
MDDGMSSIQGCIIDDRRQGETLVFRRIQFHTCNTVAQIPLTFLAVEKGMLAEGETVFNLLKYKTKPPSSRA